MTPRSRSKAIAFLQTARLFINQKNSKTTVMCKTIYWYTRLCSLVCNLQRQQQQRNQNELMKVNMKRLSEGYNSDILIVAGIVHDRWDEVFEEAIVRCWINGIALREFMCVDFIRFTRRPSIIYQTEQIWKPLYCWWRDFPYVLIEGAYFMTTVELCLHLLRLYIIVSEMKMTTE